MRSGKTTRMMQQMAFERAIQQGCVIPPVMKTELADLLSQKGVAFPEVAIAAAEGDVIRRLNAIVPLAVDGGKFPDESSAIRHYGPLFAKEMIYALRQYQPLVNYPAPPRLFARVG